MEEVIIREYAEQYLDACLSVAVKQEQVYQCAYAEILGDEIYNVAMRCWKEDLETELRNSLAEQPCLLAFQEDRLVGFVGYRQVRHIGVISPYAVDPEEEITAVLPKLLRAAFDEMKALGVTHVMANCGMEEVHNNDRKAFEAAGFKIHLPHVKYYQILGEAPELPETQVQIAPCKPEHLADCSRIAVQVWEGIHNAYIEYQGKELHDAFSGSWRESKAREVAEQQSKPEGVVALVDGKVAGFCGYRLKDDKLAILGFNGVDPEFRGKGIARYLYEYCFQDMRKRGVTHSLVYTGCDNGHAPARRAYEKAGYDKRLLSLTYYMKLQVGRGEKCGNSLKIR